MPAIVIVGMPKSGTSALYAAVKQHGNWHAIFEISNERQLAYLVRHAAPRKLAKILLSVVHEHGLDLAGFDRRIAIVRDPRDAVISWLLYRPFLHGNYRNQAFMDELLEWLERKERAPRAVSVQDLHAVYDRHGIGYTRPAQFRTLFEAERETLERYPDMAILRYEDFVDGRLDAPAAHLGVPLEAKPALGAHVSFNERSKSYGAWRHWFTPADVDVYRAGFDAYVQRHGYDTSWELAVDPVIPAATSSVHIRKHADRLLAQPESTGHLLERDRYTDERRAVLESAVDDGRETAMVELALVRRTGVYEPHDDAGAVALLEDVAARGNPMALVHRGLAHRYGVGGPRDEAAASAAFARAVQIRGNRRTKQMMADYDALWAGGPAPSPSATASADGGAR